MSVLNEGSAREGGQEPAFTVSLNGSGGPLKGWVVVDSLVDSLAMGGTRMTSDVTEAEVRALASGMTDKLTLVGLPIGGAKAGILSDGSDRENTLRTFGRTVAPLLHGGIHLGCDLGVTPADRAVFFAEAGYDPRRKNRAVDMPYDWRTYYEPLVDCTGHGVGVAAVAALERLHRGGGPRRVVVQGFGSVGRAVARFMERRGHRIVAVADVQGTISADRLPVDDLLALTDGFGRIDRSRLPQEVTVSDEPEAWLDVDADVLVLAANHNAVNSDNVHRLRARLVVEGGNITVSPEAKLKLAVGGAVLVPDVVANVGGAAAAGLALARVVPFELPGDQRKNWVFDWVGDRVRRNTLDLLEIAAATPHEDPLPALISARRKEHR
ncbi:Glu/Leu/Phe/Val dehydrogenase [Streptomyces sp. NBC_01275]|uniref:Glu/Leu/Phe/Val dehydrogenase dimerization domain-containing protein n=1 Tax=Streptomyces sp. NBC_01275 TaxID=2903807 RepID=UPI002253239A|nr:Glu/Leu/Phe/Val dehydrogenase dimerization domain-containing protein [Streptomyces sp. NBC_01275]MCX4761538.1 Glu/Leu/Phe/Val dehydrogenase [Streptomyces sp. NBC_01275]